MYSPSIEVDEVIDALALFIKPFVEGALIVRGQINRVPMPPSPCVVLTEILRTDLTIPYIKYFNHVDYAKINSSKRIDIQIDFYGKKSGDFCASVEMAFRCSYGFDNFPNDIKPLYASNSIQIPLTTGEQQSERRWTLTATLQYNPSVTIEQQYADELEIKEIIPADREP